MLQLRAFGMLTCASQTTDHTPGWTRGSARSTGRAPSNRLRPAVFLDRDGTLIEDVGVLASPDQIRLFSDTVSALRDLQRDYVLFVVTNQPGISAGHVTADQVEAVNNSLAAMLSCQGIDIAKWYVCPHARVDECRCIKPNPTFILKAAEDYGLDLRRSFVIGDHPHDALTGDAVGVFGLYLLTGHGSRHLDELPQDKLVFHTLGDAASWIAKHPRHGADLSASVQAGAHAIRRGGVVAFPTETVYGLGADAFNADAVARIYEIKRRPLHNPLIVHVSNRQQAQSLASDLPRSAEMLMEGYWPGPLTLVLPKMPAVPDIVTAGNPTVAIRMPANALALEMIRLAETPIAAPSANVFGRTSPTTARHVADQLHGTYNVLVDGGACRVGVESTVLSLASATPLLLRPGGISREEIEKIIGAVQVAQPENTFGTRYDSPGMLPSHYAPSTPLVVVDTAERYAQRSDVGVIILQHPAVTFQGPVAVLSQNGDLREAATRLYHALRTLDGIGLSLIVAEQVPPGGLGTAINDRLRKAAAPLP